MRGNHVEPRLPRGGVMRRFSRGDRERRSIYVAVIATVGGLVLSSAALLYVASRAGTIVDAANVGARIHSLQDVLSRIAFVLLAMTFLQASAFIYIRRSFRNESKSASSAQKS